MISYTWQVLSVNTPNGIEPGWEDVGMEVNEDWEGGEEGRDGVPWGTGLSKFIIRLLCFFSSLNKKENFKIKLVNHSLSSS